MASDILRDGLWRCIPDYGIGSRWTDTNVYSCALDCIIIVGVFLGAWYTQIDVASLEGQPGDTQKTWTKAVIHDWTLAKAYANKAVKNTFEEVIADLVTPGRVLAYGAVWNKCARGLRQVEIETLAIDTCSKCSTVLARQNDIVKAPEILISTTDKDDRHLNFQATIDSWFGLRYLACTCDNCGLHLQQQKYVGPELSRVQVGNLLELAPIQLLDDICIASTACYGLFHACTFISPRTSTFQSYVHTTLGHVAGRPDGFIPRAPFRLLVFGDPQLEGDSSLIDLPQIPFWSFGRAWQAWMNLRKRLDLAGNDYYLAHIYRTMHWWTDPTHVTVLGDLLGSQWLTDSEFERRATRFWTRVFRGSRRVEDEIMADEAEQETGHSLSWKWRLINVVGNHDVGYAGDMISPRIARFEQHFGKVNWVTSFRFQERTTIGSDSTSAEVAPKLRIVILNSLNLDGPEIDPDLRRQTYDFVNSIITASHPVEDRAVATVLLTHLPLPKSAGVCPDDPYIAYNDEVYGGGIKEQNHLSDSSGRSILECVFGMSGNLNAPNGGLGRPGIILTGHDHRGCDVYHHLPHADAGQESSSRRWNATRWPVSTDIANDKTIPGIREVTLRSMMGEFGGHAGLLAAWYDHSERRWRFDYSSCSLGVQHIWWAVHVLDIMTLLSFVLFVSVSLKGFVPDLGRFYDSQSVLLKQDAKRSSSEKPLHKTSALEVNRLSQLQRRRAPT